MKCNNDLASITTTNFSNSKLDIQIVKKSVEFKNSLTYNGLISNPLSLGSFSQTFLLTILGAWKSQFKHNVLNNDLF